MAPRLLVVFLTTTILFEAGAVAPASTFAAPNVEPESPAAAPPIGPPVPTELVDRRTATSQTFDNRDGTYTTEVSPDPIFYQPRGLTVWEPIVLGFEASTKPGEVAVSDRAAVAVSLAESDAAHGFVKVTAGDYVVAFRLIGSEPGSEKPMELASVTPVTDGPVADYADVLPGVDLRLIAGAFGVKSFLILKRQPDQSSFTFLVDAPGLTLQAEADGSVSFIGAKGELVGRMPRPYAVDSSISEERGGGAFSDAVGLKVAEVDGRPTVTVSVDPDYLATASYPVYVDPDFYTGTATYGDAFASAKYPTMNFQDYVRPDSPFYHEHWLGMDPTNSINVNEVYMKFDLSTIPNVSVDSAILKVFPYHQYYSPPTATTTWVNKVSATWTEAGLTWNNRPASTALTSQGLVEGVTSSFSVTSTVQAWVSAPTTNYGFKLHENGNNGTYWKRLISAEQGGANIPVLTVTYHIPTASPTKPIWTTSRALTWNYADPGGHAQSHFQAQVSTVSNFSSILSDSGVVAGAATSWSIPGGVTLTSGSQYYWRVQVKDGTGWSVWASSYFLWDVGAPTGSISLNGGAATTDTSTVRIDNSGTDPGTSNVYANDGRSTTTFVAGCGSVVCGGAWASPVLGTDKAQSAAVVESNSTGGTWHSLTIDAAATNRPTLAMDVMRDSTSSTYVGVVSDDHDGFRYELHTVAGSSSFSTLAWTATSTPGTYTTQSVSLSFTVGVWYRLIISAADSTGASYNLWWYPAASVQPTAPTLTTLGVYLPKPRLHLFQYASSAAPGTVWLDNLKVTQTGTTAPFGSGISGVRYSSDGGTNWGNWMGYADSLSYTLPAGSGSKTVSAQFRDALGNVSSTVSDSITVAFGNFGRQRQHSFETWDLGAGDELAVNIATGNLVLTHPLVTLPYRGGSLPLSLTYNSQDTANVGMGPGFRLSLQRRLTLNGDSTVTFIDVDGERSTFTSPVTVGSVTTYTRPAGLYATLVKDTAQGVEFTLTYRDQSRDKFDIVGSEGLLVRAEDRHAAGVTVAYGGGTDTSTATDDTGRQVTFTWNTGTSPHQLTSVADWAWIDASGVVQISATGTLRTYRFFYDGSGNLIGWADPLNTSATCPTGGSHLTCLTYASGTLQFVNKTQTVETFSAGTLGTTTLLTTTSVTYSANRIASVKDGEQYYLGSAGTSFVVDFADRVVVSRPTTTTTYGLLNVADYYARIASTWRRFDPLTEIEQRTTWNATFPTEPATLIDNATALQSTPARTLTYTYVAGSFGLLQKLVEPLTGTTNRWTEYVYNANNDVTQRTVSQDGSGTLRTITRYCYEATCATSGVGPDLLKQIDNYVDGLNGTNDTDVVTDYLYDAYGQRTRVTRHNRDAAGAVLDDRVDGSTYDSAGNQTSQIVNYVNGVVTNPGDDITPNATLLARTDLTTTYSYDTAGNQVSAADPRRAIEVAKGTSLGPDDFVTRWTFDALNQRMTETTPATPGSSVQRTATNTYDELGSIREATDFGGTSSITTGTEYDRAARATYTYQRPAGQPARVTAEMVHDGDGRVLTSKDERQYDNSALGYTAHTFDALGRQTSVTKASGTADSMTTAAAFDALDRHTSNEVGVDAAASQLSLYTYDLGGRVTETNDGFACARDVLDYRDSVVTVIEGLAAGVPCTGSGLRTITNNYDGLGRRILSQVTAGQGLNDRTADDLYDSVGNRQSSSATQAGVATSTTFALNLLDQVIVEQRSNGTWAKTTYDPAGNSTDRCLWPSQPADPCLPAGSTFGNPQPTSVTTTTYDARNQRISLVDGTTSVTTTYAPDHNYQVSATYVPTAAGREHQSLYSYDGQQHRRTTATHQLCSIVEHPCSGPNILQTTGSDGYEYDDANSRTRVNESNGASGIDRYYCYDAGNRVVSTRSAAGCSTGLLEAYTYDAAGNRLTAGSVTFTYDATGELTACSPSCGTIAYDAAARMTKWNGWAFEFDAAARMTRACQSTTTCAGDLNEIEFSYDGDGHRTQMKKFVTGSVVPTETWDFRYQGDAIVEEKLTDAAHPSGAVVRSYLVDDTGAVVKMTRSFGDGSDGTYLVTWNGHGDALALWRVESSGALTLANGYTYATWGAPTTTTHNGYPDLGFRFLYVGQQDVQWDNIHGLGLYYMHARQYAPTLGRFLQTDPIRAESNAYAYAHNSPVTFADPDGTLCFVPILGQIACGAVLIYWVGAFVVTAYAASTVAVGVYRYCGRFGCNISFARSGAKTKAAPRATSPGAMQKQVERGQAPRTVDRVDPQHAANQNPQPHVHFKDGYARNQNGTTKEGTTRPLTRAEREWLNKNGWK